MHRFRAVERMLERVQSLMIPARQVFVRLSLHKRHVNLDRRRLPDPVQPSNSLLEQAWIGGQIIEHKVMRELKIPSLAPDLGADQNSRAVLLRKIRGIPVPLKEGQFLVKEGNRHIQSLAQPLLDLLGRLARRHDQ